MRISILPVVLLLAAACSETTTADEPGDLTFTYSGSANGRFSAIAVPGGVGQGNGAGAVWEGEWLHVAGVRTYANSQSDAIALEIPKLTAAPSTFSIATEPCFSPGCPYGAVSLKQVLSLPTAPTVNGAFWFTSGEIDVTFYDGSEVRGTFRGVAHNSVTGGAIHVENGQFDVMIAQ